MKRKKTSVWTKSEAETGCESKASVLDATNNLKEKSLFLILMGKNAEVRLNTVDSYLLVSSNDCIFIARRCRNRRISNLSRRHRRLQLFLRRDYYTLKRYYTTQRHPRRKPWLRMRVPVLNFARFPSSMSITVCIKV